MRRRDFIKITAAGTVLAMLDSCRLSFEEGKDDKVVGKVLEAWKKGQFQVHFIYTGVCESMFMILPDGTTMLLDCGDHDAIGRGELAVPVLPGPERHSGEWIARYVERVNPQKRDVDYMMLSHLHNDHAGWDGFYASVLERDGKPYPLSGFTQVAETLRFGKAIDRGYPDYSDPLPLLESQEPYRVMSHMKRLYEWKQKTEGLKVEKFQIGATDQVAMLKSPGSYPGFHIRNIACNGRILKKDGTIRDLYKERIERDHPQVLNENGMSLGLMFEYGDFRFYSAGDFSDSWRQPDGSVFYTEDAIAEELGPVHVSKINHHGYKSMTDKLVAALRSRVYVTCVWDQLHDLAETYQRIMNPANYKGERLLCPGIFPKERRQADEGQPWIPALEPNSFEGGHVVLTVEKGGKSYSIQYVGVQDEDMIVKSCTRFKTCKPEELI